MVSVVGQLYINFYKVFMFSVFSQEIVLNGNNRWKKKLSFQKQNLQIDILDDNLI